MKTFADIAIGSLFWFAGELWERVEAEGLWNARCSWGQGERWGQFDERHQQYEIVHLATGQSAVVAKHEWCLPYTCISWEGDSLVGDTLADCEDDFEARLKKLPSIWGR